MAKRKQVVEQDEGERIEGPEARKNPPGWSPEKTRASIRRATGAVKGSDIRPPRPDYEPKQSSVAYLSTTFGSIPSDVAGSPDREQAEALTVPVSMADSPVGEPVIAALEDVREAWAEVDRARGPILSNEMETRHKRLDQLDQFAAARRQRAEQAVDGALEEIDAAIADANGAAVESLKPRPNDAAMVSMWQAALSNKSHDELRKIVSGAIESGDKITLQASLGAPEWMVELGASRGELMRRYEETIPAHEGYSLASYRDALNRMRERIAATRQVVGEHFDGVLGPQDRADLRRAREQQAAAAKVTG